MKKFFARTLAAFVICTLAGASALADNKKDQIRVTEEFQLNGASVEKGTYEVSFDEKAGEISLKRHGKVIARSKARAERSESKSKYTTFTVGEAGGGRVLRSVKFAGDKQTVVVGEGGGAATAGTQQ